MKSVLLQVTPEMALDMLGKSAGNPRYGKEGKVNKSIVEKYATDMRNGNWQITHQGIAFDENGLLVDGHHRLSAVLKSGATVPMYVTYGIPANSVILDCGYSRSPSQIMQFSLHADKMVSSGSVIATAKLHFYFLCGEDRKKMESKSNFEIMDFIVKNKDVFYFVSCLQERKKDGKRPLKNASFGHAAFCAVSCGVEKQVIQNFADVFVSGLPRNETEYAAIIAKNEMQNYSRRADQGFRAYQSKFIQTAIYDFAHGVKRVRKYKNPQAIYTNKMIEKEVIQ